MRTTMRPTVAEIAAVALLAALGAGDAFGQSNPATHLGISYQHTGGQGDVRGVSVHVDRARWGNLGFVGNVTHIRGSQQTTFFGGGLGYRHPFNEDFDGFVHGMFGYERGSASYRGHRATGDDWKPRVGAGVSYAFSASMRARVGVDYDTHAQVLGGVGWTF